MSEQGFSPPDNHKTNPPFQERQRVGRLLLLRPMAGPLDQTAASEVGTSQRGGLLASVPVLRSQLTEASFLALRYCALCRLLLLCSACAGLAGGLTGRPKLCPRQVCCPAALRINRVISSGCEINERWLAFTSMVWAPIRLAMKRSRSGLMVRSSVETA